MDFDFLVFIGRFQPFHRGHEAVLRKALACAEQVIVLVGSAHRPRCPRNPWRYPERVAMIESTLSAAERSRVHIAPVMDATYNDDLWLTAVQQTVAGIVAGHHGQPHRPPRIGLIGHAKDQTSYYLKCFPQWSSVDVPELVSMDGTAVRQRLFADETERWSPQQVAAVFADALPEGVCARLADWVDTADFAAIRAEAAFVARYRASWDVAPYPPTFVTVDAVIVQSGHVLLVERGAAPGKGLWALPGGFVDQEETLREAMLRELREETRLKVPAPVLLGSIAGEGVFDDPHRSARGRTITHAYFIHLPPDTGLPKVKGSDDAKQAFWLPLADLDPAKMFEDHYFIIQRLLVGRLANQAT